MQQLHTHTYVENRAAFHATRGCRELKREYAQRKKERERRGHARAGRRREKQESLRAGASERENFELLEFP